MSKKISAGALSFLNGYGSESEETQSMSEDETVEPPKERSDTVKESPETAESIVRGILDDLIKSLSVSSSSSLCSMNNMESSYIEDRKGGMDVSEDSSEADEEESKRLEERRKEWRVDDRRCSASSSSSSSSDSSSSDSSSSSSSDEDDSDGEEEEEGSKPKGPQNKKKSKAEFSIHDLPPIEDLHITVPEHECVELGQVSSIVDTLVVVQSMPGKPAVDLESVLFLDKGSRPLGKVFDVIGPVSLPLYCVRFNSHDHIKEAGVSVGTSVYVAPRTEHTAFIFFDQLLKMKGTDASWKDDQETPAQFADYSDDESEQKSRRKNKNATYKPGDEGGPGGGGDGAPPARKQKRAYNPPRPGSQRSQQNIFYRQNRRFNPRDHGGGIRWDRPPPPPPVQAPHYGGGHPPAPGPSAPQMYSVPPPQPPHGPQSAGYSGPQTYQGASSSGYHHQYPPPPPPPIQHPPGQFHRPPPPPLYPQQQQPSWGSGGQKSGYPQTHQQMAPRPLPNPFSATSNYPPPPPPPPAPQPTFGSPYDGTKPPGT